MIKENNNKFKLSLVDFKTAGVAGKQVFDLDDELNESLLKYIEYINLENGTPLFVSPKDKKTPLTRLNLTKGLQRSSKKYLNKSISTNVIRKAYASQNKEAVKSIQENSELMAHSVSTHINNYVVQ